LDQDADHTHQGQGHGHHGDDGCATPPRGTSLDSAGGTPLHFEDVASPDIKKPPKCAKHSVDKNLGFGGISPGERFVCYMCYETHDTEEDALVAPCDCRGDTRYVHTVLYVMVGFTDLSTQCFTPNMPLIIHCSV